MSFLKAMMEKEPPEPENPIGIVAIGNLEGDAAHETAREMVRKALKRAQFKTVNLGKGVPADVFASKAKEVNADIIAVSVNTVPAKNNLAKLDEALKASGLKGKVILMIGGAAVKKEDAEAIGALYGRNKEEGVEIAKKAIAGIKK
jgi:methanogenic corrinoid protein MtbC1